MHEKVGGDRGDRRDDSRLRPAPRPRPCSQVCSKVDEFVPLIHDVNLRIVCQLALPPDPARAARFCSNIDAFVPQTHDVNLRIVSQPALPPDRARTDRSWPYPTRFRGRGGEGAKPDWVIDSPVWGDRAVFHSKVDEFVPQTHDVNLRIVSQRALPPEPARAARFCSKVDEFVPQTHDVNLRIVSQPALPPDLARTDRYLFAPKLTGLYCKSGLSTWE